jgi:hypothetical protein
MRRAITTAAGVEVKDALVLSLKAAAVSCETGRGSQVRLGGQIHPSKTKPGQAKPNKIGGVSSPLQVGHVFRTIVASNLNIRGDVFPPYPKELASREKEL